MKTAEARCIASAQSASASLAGACTASKTSGANAAKSRFLRLSLVFLVWSAGVSTDAASPEEPAAGDSSARVYQKFSPGVVPDEPFQWMMPRREMLYMRHEDDYFREFIESRLEPPRTGNLFNANARTFFGIPNSPQVGMIWADGTISLEGVPGFAARLFRHEPPCTLTFQPANAVNFKQYLDKNYLPFVNTEWSYQSRSGPAYRTTIAGVAWRERLLYVLRLSVVPRGSRPGKGGDAHSHGDPPYSWDMLMTGADFELGPGGTLRNAAGIFGRAIGKFTKVGQQLRAEARIRAQPEQWICVAAGAPLEPAECEALDAETVRALFEKQRRDWDEFLAQGATLDLPIPMIGDAFRASLINMKIAQRKVTVGDQSYYLDVPGATIYKQFWWRDGGFIQHAWDASGHHDEAARGLALATHPKLPAVINRQSASVNVWLPYEKAAAELGDIGGYQINQRADGSWTAPPGQWDSTGIALWALSSHYLMTRKAQWLSQALPCMERGADFLRQVRVGTPAFDDWVEKYWPAYARVRKYAEPWDEGLLPGGGGEGGARSNFQLPLGRDATESELRRLATRVPKQSYFHDFFAVLGLRSYAQVLEQSGRGDPAPFRQSAADLVTALERSIRKTMTRFDITWIPAGPDGDVKTALIGSVLDPCRVFPPDHPLVNGTIAYFRANAKPHLAPEGFYGTHPDRWSYTQASLGGAYLQRGETARAQRLLDTFLRVMWLPGSWSENVREPHSRTVFGDQPHLWAASLYVLLLREFLLREENSTLRIADGLHPLWLPAGKSLSVSNAPTAFGATVSYALRRSEDGKRVSLDVSAKGPLPAAFSWAPRGFGQLVSASLNGAALPAHDGDLRFSGATNRVEAVFAGE